MITTFRCEFVRTPRGLSIYQSDRPQEEEPAARVVFDL